MSRIPGAMSPADLTDEQLGRQALRGDRDAFTELFGRHESGLYNVAYRLTGSREDAADITQEAFLRVFARLDDLAGREVNLPAYLHRTARNLVYDRSAAHARETPVDEIAGAAGADEALEADPQLTALVSAQGEAVRAANARLPERHRLVLALRELEDMSYDDIGRVLDVTPGAVAQLLGRARMALRRELRLQQVDAERMDPDCRARLGAIGALIDGELDADRAQVLTQHLAGCPACLEARAAFEEARVTYRAWLPLPILLGLGAETARAAEARGLVRFDGGTGGGDWGDDGPGSGGRGGGGGPLAGGVFGSRRRILVGSLALLLVVGVSTVVGIRSASDDPIPEPPPPAVVAAGSTTTASTTAPAPPTMTVAAGTTSAAAPGTSTGASFVAPPTVPGVSAPAATVGGAAGVTTARARTRRTTPAVTVAGDPVVTVAPPVTQAPPATETAPPPEPPVTDRPTTTRGPNDPGTPCVPGTPCTPSDPPTTTRREPPPPPPVTTIRIPPVITIAPPVR